MPDFNNIGSMEIGAVVFSLIFLIAGLGFIKKNKRIRQAGAKVKGVVHWVETSTDADGCLTYYPVIRFATSESQEWITKRYDVGGQESAYKYGDEVAVIYNTTNPEDFIIDDKRSRNIGPIFLTIGITGVVISVILMVVKLFNG